MIAPGHGLVAAQLLYRAFQHPYPGGDGLILGGLVLLRLLLDQAGFQGFERFAA